MRGIELSIDTEPDPRDVAALGDGLTEHALPVMGEPGFRPIAVFARDPDGALVAGVHGFVNWNWLQMAPPVLSAQVAPGAGRVIKR